jgi:IrrE N-terminal-like domain
MAHATNGNRVGYARGRTIAVSPTSPLPHLTRFHELAHVLLGHTGEGDQNDGALTPRDLCEGEAEAVAMRRCAALGLPGVEFGGTYIWHWWGWKDTEAVRPADSEGGRSDPEGGRVLAG